MKKIAMYKLVYIILSIFIGSISLLAQDLIYSQFNSMPLAVNPAFAGNNSCNYRISAIGRSQWVGVDNVNSYKSASIAGDFNLNNVYDVKTNLWGVGFLLNYDQSGIGSFTNLSLIGNLAYHARFGDEGQNFLSFGMSAGMANRGLTVGKYVFASQLDEFGRINPGVSGEDFSNASIWYPELGFGGLITLNPNENTNIYGGASVFHLLSPNISLTNVEYKLPMRMNFHVGGNFYRMGLLFLPSVYIQSQQFLNYNIGTYVGAILISGNERKNPLLGYLGLWYKSTDAIVPAVRFDIGRMTLAFSYDIHVGGISQNLSGVGSPELSINYYGCFGRSSRRTGCPSL